MPADLSKMSDVILQNIQEYFLALHEASIKNEHIVAWLTGFSHPLCNMVIDTHLTEVNVQDWITMILAQAKSRNYPLSWWVTPFTTPSNLKEKLVQNSFAFVGNFPAMAKNLKDNDKDISIDQLKITVRRIYKRIEANPWGDIMGDAFAFSPGLTERYLEFAFKSKKQSFNPFEHYLGFIKEKPVTTGTLYLDPKRKIAGIYNIATPEETRKHGLATQMMLFLIHRAKALGYEVAVLWSSPMFENLCAKIEFQNSFNISLYAHS